MTKLTVTVEQNGAIFSTTDIPMPPTELPGADFVRRYPLRIESAAAADIIRPAFNAKGGNESTSVPAGKIVDWRGRVAIQHDPGQGPDTAFDCRSLGADCCWTGGTIRVTNPQNDTMTWKEIHGGPWANDKGINFENNQCGDTYLEGFNCDGAGIDGMGPPSVGNRTFRTFVNACRWVRIRDDACQNDALFPVSFKNCLLQGHAVLSQKPGADGNPPPTNFATEFDHCLLWVKRQPYDSDEKGTDVGVPGSKREGPFNSSDDANQGVVTGSKQGWAHKWFFKGVPNVKPVMRWCLLRIDTVPVEGPKIARFPKGIYERVTVLYFGGNKWDATFEQSKAELAKMGITVIDDIDRGWPIWQTNEAAWYRVNGWDQTSQTFDWTRAAA
jgi:hypothetical protein